MHHFIVTEGLGPEELVEWFIERVYSLHSLPTMIISDRGTQFVSMYWRALSARLAVTLRPSLAFHLKQTDKRKGLMLNWNSTFDYL
jgi:hypothetical protein